MSKVTIELKQTMDGPGVATGATVVTGANGAVTRNDPILFGATVQSPMTLVAVYAAKTA
jgi:hypothetical protein